MISGYILTAASLLISVTFLCGTLIGIQKGVMHICVKPNIGLTFYRAEGPEVFWAATTVNLGFSALFLYFSIRLFHTRIKPNKCE